MRIGFDYQLYLFSGYSTNKFIDYFIEYFLFQEIIYILNYIVKFSGLVHWEDPEGSGGEEGGRGDRDGEYMQIHGWFISMYGQNHYNTVK